MASRADNVVALIATSDLRPDARRGAWQERASKCIVIVLAAMLLLPVLLTFMFLAVFVARLLGVPLNATALPERSTRAVFRAS